MVLCRIVQSGGLKQNFKTYLNFHCSLISKKLNKNQVHGISGVETHLINIIQIMTY